MREAADPHKVKLDAWKHPLLSDYWHYSTLVQFYSGWYPVGDIFIEIAKEIGYEIISKEETVNDYLQTSLAWRYRLRNAMSSCKGLYWCWYIWLYYLFTDPIFSYYCLSYHWGCSWTWQFEKRYDKKNDKVLNSACTHYTMTFRKPLRN